MHGKADRLKGAKAPKNQQPIDSSLQHRLPPGQSLTEKFPILHEGEVPVYDLATWNLRVFGEVEEERTFTYDELKNMKQSRVVSDIHCVTRWSKFDAPWDGVLFTDLLKELKVKPEAKSVMIHADPDYDTNVPLVDLMRNDILLAFDFDSKPLTLKHGWPLRLVVPHLYFWKSAKWIRGIEFMKEDREGFWERNGFHNTADPFLEQRFSGEDIPIPEDEWTRKEFD
ncbi:sulfite oxidase-like oxidoreductase [Paenibacillus macquariensis]|uniref:DMSO/TMAO reductase YedYZ, molybdopterin-dependent catalytic subunit n=1 Tax=Paenibacillus macquariensis TaxID=948756 RepID=A0ABY1K3F3_9BACL|nr:sulfite oxidase-like oxidoreductase [Paenibacillus macquariensis]MEC0090360.1 sulfite oxidase-like oxidoreductase [Paenibacillus macquariensis]OAB39713.1 oxidoreductase [Paenibacillus macquariensis subsp. macquariensis]SIR19930.1 DMSO/TMAO reductase YedYZ, molybdopterin-dependent catalytic subunit [Paenibacillus macquariensis]